MAAVLSALILAAACTHDGGVTVAIPHATIGTAPERTTTTNPYAVPATIDAAYVNRVLAALDGVVGDIVRSVVKARGVTPEIRSRMEAVFTDGLVSFTVLVFERDAQRNFSGYFPEPGNKKTTVVQILRATPECIFARVRRDYSAVGPSTSPDSSVDEAWVALVPVSPARDPGQINPTPWMFAYEGYPSDHSEPKNACNGV